MIIQPGRAGTISVRWKRAPVQHSGGALAVNATLWLPLSLLPAHAGTDLPHHLK